MSTVLLFCVIISLSVAAPISENAQATIISYVNNIDGEGNYEFSYETSNGISRKESGRLVNVGSPDEHIEVRGVYYYTDVEGKLIVVNYTADENGYHVEENLPTPLTPPSTPIPPAVVASLLG